MTYGQLFSALDSAGLSPEAAAKRLGVSNMTLRRWRSQPRSAELPAKYARAFAPALAQLAAESGSGSAKAAKAAVAPQKEGFQATLERLGFPNDILTTGVSDREAMINGLSQVGADPDRRREVDDSRKHILSFSRFGAEWKARVGRLLEVLSAPQLMAAEKLVAYGALFYLINPFDLIPDAIPVIGYFDDFAVLGIAVWYYNRLLSRRRAARGEAPPPASE